MLPIAILLPRPARFSLLLLLLAGELVLSLYLAAFAGLMSSWFIDDSVAFRFSAGDWWHTGLIRFAKFALASVVGGVLVSGINRLAITRLGLDYPRLPRRSALALGGVVVLAAGLGSAYFVLTRPFM